MRLDGYAILKSVAGHAELFSDARDAVDKAALNIVAAQFKAKTFDLDRLKRACEALGTKMLALVLEHLPDKIPEALVDRIDPHHPRAADGSGPWAREHVMSLASGKAKPEPKPLTRKKAGSAKGKKKPKPEDDFVVEGFWATSVMAKPKRRSKSRGKSSSS
jgi:hypothetical protein